MSDRRPLDSVTDLVEVLRRVKHSQMDAFEQAILSSDRVFVTGLGRTGLMARGFAMRLMHLGRRVYHVGDVITPAIGPNDLLIICSRTGRSKVLSHFIRIARKAEASVAVVTAYENSKAAQRADTALVINDKVTHDDGGIPLPLGSLFEQALLIVLDQAVLSLMEALGLTEKDLAQIHTKFE